MYKCRKAVQLWSYKWIYVQVFIVFLSKVEAYGSYVPVLSCSDITRTKIYEVQGRSLESPLRGARVEVPGIVTFITSKGFYMQEPVHDEDPSTSDGIFVYTPEYAKEVTIGEFVLVLATVSEYFPSYDQMNYPITELTGVRTLLKCPNLYPEGTEIKPIVIGCGSGHRRTPTEVVGVPDAVCRRDPGHIGVEFWESLESMLVEVSEPIAVSATDHYGITWVVPSQGECATGMNERGGITIDPSVQDFNPERLGLSFTYLSKPHDPLGLESSPVFNMGDRVKEGVVRGLLSYSFGEYRLMLTAPATPEPRAHMQGDRALAQDQSDSAEIKRDTLSRGSIRAADTFTMGTYNIENFNAHARKRSQLLAKGIVENLGGPDLLALQEVQDNVGPKRNDTCPPRPEQHNSTAANLTLGLLIAAVKAAGGPTYRFVNIDPINCENGGQPGGNIRAALLYNPERLTLAESGSGAGNATLANELVTRKDGRQGLKYNPGLLDPTNIIFQNSRKPLVAQFDHVLPNRPPLMVVTVHLMSKLGSSPLYGYVQPPIDGGVKARVAQAEVVRDFVSELLDREPGAHVVVLGDFNDFQLSPPVELLAGPGAPLSDPLESLSKVERYTYNYQGNSQALDHILLSPALAALQHQLHIAHINTGRALQASDHDPSYVEMHFLDSDVSN